MPIPGIAGAVLGALLVTSCTASTSPSAHTPPAETQVTRAVSPAEDPGLPEESGVACMVQAQALTVEQQAGQLFMLGVSTSGIDSTTRAVIRTGGIGSVVLLEESTAGLSQIAALTAEISALGTSDLPILIAVDQEGGSVQRLKGPGFSDIPAALSQGAMGEGELRVAAKKWGEELKRAGVDYALAPVADVVSTSKQSSNVPIGSLKRNFGTDVGTVSASVTDFIQGMDEAGVVTSLKHFPGLGEVTTNTDFAVAIDDDITVDDQYLDPFRVGIEAGADSVMVSSAIFNQIDPDQEGVFSPAIVTTLLRDNLGFEGVVISDDLGAAAAVAHVDPADRALRFFAAGGDLLINADPSMMDEMLEAILIWAENPENAMRLAESAGRVLRLKESAGLLVCS